MSAIDEAISTAGGVAALAAQVGENPSTVGNWKLRQKIPPGKCRKVEEVTGVSVHRLCEEVFGPGTEVEPQPEATHG